SACVATRCSTTRRASPRWAPATGASTSTTARSSSSSDWSTEMAEILYVNPIGSGAFDQETIDLIDAIRSPQHTPRVRHLADGGPPHLEYHLYEHEAFSGMLQLMQEAEADGCGAG